MMKLHILSDLHTEFADFVPPETDADVVILAGDIGVGLCGIKWAANIQVLNDDKAVIDGIRFLGSTLWTDFQLFGEGNAWVRCL